MNQNSIIEVEHVIDRALYLFKLEMKCICMPAQFRIKPSDPHSSVTPSKVILFC